MSWSHYVELIPIELDLERQFYEKQCALENWSIRELKRQKASALFLRLAAGQDKDSILKLAKQPVVRVKVPVVLAGGGEVAGAIGGGFAGVRIENHVYETSKSFVNVLPVRMTHIDE